jgi:hypothetical protein
MLKLSEARKLSAALLGNMYRMEIAAAIADAGGENVTLLGLAAETQIFYQRVQEDVQRLVKSEMLSLVQTVNGAKQYKPTNSCYWAMCKSLRVELLGR